MKQLSHWSEANQCDNCFMNPPSIFTLLFSFGSFVWTISLSPMLTMALKHSPLWRASMEALTWSKPLNVWVMKGSKAISPLITVYTSLGTSVLDFQPPKAVPFQFLPVTSWNGLVEISFPAAATPMTQLSPHPLCATSSAHLITCTLPVQS